MSPLTKKIARAAWKADGCPDGKGETEVDLSSYETWAGTIVQAIYANGYHIVKDH